MDTPGDISTILSQLWVWLRENKRWVFSGVGVGVPLALIGWLIAGRSGNNQSIRIQGRGSIIEGGIRQNINIGYTFEELRALIADRDKLTELEIQLGVTEQALGTFFGILEREVPPEQWPVRLAEIAHRHKQALERLAALETDDPRIRALAGQAWAAVEAGDYDRAEDLLDQAKRRELAGIQAAEKLLQAAQAAIERRRLSAATFEAEQAELSLIRLRYRQAAEGFAAAAALVPDSKPKQRLAYRERHAGALYRQGDEKGDNAALNAAIRAYRDLLAAYPRDRVPLDWTRTQNNLGNTLARLGERESGTARLEEAVAAFRAEVDPNRWTVRNRK